MNQETISCDRLYSIVPDRIINKIYPDENGCWIWTASNKKGYGHASINKKTESIHRYLYKRLVRIPDKGTDLHHKCHNRSCANPGHLEEIRKSTHAKMHVPKLEYCKRGHKFTPENSMKRPDGCKGCRKCHNMRNREWKRKNWGYKPRKVGAQAF